jgi:hypothetical protein
MPEVRKGESEQDFVSRAIPKLLEDGTAKDQKQAAAIAYSMWREKKNNANEVTVYRHKCVKNEEPINYEEFYKAIMGGGLSIGKTEFSQDQLQKGIEVEKEHIDPNNPYAEMIAKKIAKDHLAELPDYYNRLAKMEGE